VENLHEMDNDNAPCLKDFPYEFYKVACDFVKPYLLSVYHEALRTSSPGLEINKGLIK